MSQEHQKSLRLKKFFAFTNQSICPEMIKVYILQILIVTFVMNSKEML